MSALQSLRIIFMGTPEFAVASLDALLKAGAQIVTVITAPDKPSGRGMKLSQSAVKKYATVHQIPVLQPEKLKNPGFIEQLRALKADLQVVVAFRMLPEIVWNMPPMGTINLHGSLLPRYRGAAPINWAVINGDKETGVTTFKLQQDIDTGNMLFQEKMPIGAEETAGEVHDRMMELGARVLVKTVEAVASGRFSETPQPDAGALPAPKIHSETCKIDWNQPVDKLHNLIRGLSPYPGAFTTVDNKIFKIFKSRVIKEAPTAQPGTLVTDHKTYIRFAAADGYIQAEEIQLEGKKKMATDAFLRGHHL